MKVKNVKNIVIVAILLGGCYMSWNFYFKDYIQQDTVNIHVFPKEISGWTSEELTITDDEYAILETRNAFVRKYSNGDGKEVYFFTVYSQNNRKVSHPPEICYTGGGITVLDNQPAQIKADDVMIPVRKLNLDQGRFEHVAYYWFKVGDSFTSNYWEQQFKIALNTFLGKNSSSALIRLSAVAQNGNKAKAEEDIQEFAKLIFQDIKEYLP
ncbi:MAG: EpsI family protein [Candidatus Omnitrophica bacterium]|nr:EpsI family protein [Candidatus Omnitrophota bacterium]